MGKVYYKSTQQTLLFLFWDTRFICQKSIPTWDLGIDTTGGLKGEQLNV
jgi:hypothetical protein